MRRRSTSSNHPWRRLAIGCLATLALAAAACGGGSPTGGDDDLPVWLETMISGIRSEPVTNPPTAIYSYRYRGELVYFRPARCCDLPSQLWDRAGTLVCSPDGGLAGGGDARCPDFFTARRDEQLIWRDPRG